MDPGSTLRMCTLPFAYGLDVNAAVIARHRRRPRLFGARPAASLPAGGELSDWLVARGISRPLVAIAWLMASMALLLPAHGRADPGRGAGDRGLPARHGSVNSLPAHQCGSVRNTYGPGTTGSIVSFINTVAQVLGATSLGMSGTWASR